MTTRKSNLFQKDDKKYYLTHKNMNMIRDFDWSKTTLLVRKQDKITKYIRYYNELRGTQGIGKLGDIKGPWAEKEDQKDSFTCNY